MINRIAEKELRTLAKQFRAIAVTGPRQSGKSTLVRHVFSDKDYVSLENPDTRAFAIEDPRGFLNQYPNGAILDEVQRTPDIFSYLQQILDENNQPGMFILTGSNNFLLRENISQSLSGRIAYLELMPLSVGEIPTDDADVLESIWSGGYPEIFDKKIDPYKWNLNYIRTYIERDVRQLKNINDLDTFERFLRLCAGRSGQIINKQSLSVETGVDAKTTESWLKVLEETYVIYRLKPHHRNFNKRLVKMPKLYFIDTGLACTLLGINNSAQLRLHPLYGNLFENLVVSELIKNQYNSGLPDQLFFWRDNTGHEIDILVDLGSDILPVEIKSGQTISQRLLSGLDYYRKLSGSQKSFLIYGGTENQKRSSGLNILSWRNSGKVFI